MTSTKLKVADFYAGVGGISLGFEQTGYCQTTYAIDINYACKFTYDLNHTTKLTVKDINELKADSLNNVDIICAGFNCQPFSVAGKRKGFNDARTDSIYVLFNIIQHQQPLVVFFENVKGLLTHDNGKSIQKIYNMLYKCGMQTIFCIPIDTSEVCNIPQHRERIYIVALQIKLSDADIKDSFNFTQEPLTTSFKDFLEDETIIVNNDNTNTNHKQTRLQSYYYTNQSTIYPKLQNCITDHNTVYQYRRGLVRANKSGLVPTLVATMGTGGHNVPIIKTAYGIRKLTPRECFNLQGYPRNFQLPNIANAHLYKQAGNSVTVPVIKKIADEIIRVLIKYGKITQQFE